MKRRFFLFLLVFFCSFCVKAQDEQLKSFYIFNIIRYVDWPEHARKGNFIISVVENNGVAQFLKSQISGRKFGSQEIEVREYPRIEDIGKCHVLFLGSGINTRGFNKTVMDNILSSGVLIITETNGDAPYGTAINFVERDETLFFELHSKNAERAGLQFSRRLVAMSTAINL